MRTKLFLLILFSLFFLSGINAQKSGKITITGTVLDLYEKPIPNAIIMIDNQKTSCLTDSAGNYSLKVKTTASKIGVLTLGNGYFEEEINNRNKIDINFSSIAKAPVYTKRTDDPDSEEAELRGRNREGEVAINIGYAIIKRKYLTSDIDFIDATKDKFPRYSSVVEMILSEVSGVARYGNRIIILSSKDLYGFIDPLIMVDGVYVQPGDLSLIAPVTVESVAVLKSASAAIYGSRGYGGAIIVTTRMSN
jgi:TonB-dependent SusC/RagA subfamily outer membrane receptor